MSDILEDQKIHYIVKDYRRMYNQHGELVKELKRLQDEALHKDNRIRDLERQVENLKNQISPEPPASLKKILGEMDNQLRSIVSRAGKVIEYVEEARTLTK